MANPKCQQGVEMGRLSALSAASPVPHCCPWPQLRVPAAFPALLSLGYSQSTESGSRARQQVGWDQAGFPFACRTQVDTYFTPEQ